MKNTKASWDRVIDSENSVFKLDVQDIWFYRDLLFLLVKRDFISFYKQTILGPIWFFIQPIFTTLVYTFVFGGLANLGTDGIPQPLFYLTGITMWNYFSDCVTKTSTVFKDNANIFGKVYFPRLIMPLSIIVSNLVRFLVQFILLLLVLMYYIIDGVNFDITWYVLFTPFLVILMALLGLGLGLIIAALTTKYRDLAFLVTFGIQLVMYTTTVIYPLSNAPANYKSLIILNPMTGIIESFRVLFLGEGLINWGILGYSVLFTIVVLISGVLIFNKTEKSFVDTV